MEISVLQIVLMCFCSFFAGFIDSVVGGGGLIQLPAFLLLLPGAPVVTVLGTNKIVSFMGTSMACWQYARKITIPWKIILPSALIAFCCSFIGARVVSLVDPNGLRPLIIVMLIFVAVFIALRRDFGAAETTRVALRWQRPLVFLAAAAIGFYDGFFGPGTGTFLIFAFVGILGLEFLTASASSKIINWSTNLAAVLYFLFTGQVLLLLAVPMMGCNILGAVVGSRMAMLKGNRFIRVMFLVVVAAIVVKLSFDIFRG